MFKKLLDFLKHKLFFEVFFEDFNNNKKIVVLEQHYQKLYSKMNYLQKEYNLHPNKRLKSAKLLKADIELARTELENVLDKIHQLESNAISQN